MLTSENEIAVLISKFLTEILSAQRPSFLKLCIQINCPRSSNKNATFITKEVNATSL